MKFTILITLFVLHFGHQVCGQDSIGDEAQPPVFRNSPTKITKTKPPLFLIKSDDRIFQVAVGKGDLLNSRKVKRVLKHLDTEWIVSINVLKGDSAVKEYGSRGENGVVIINLREGVFDKLPGRLRKHEIHQRS